MMRNLSLQLSEMPSKEIQSQSMAMGKISEIGFMYLTTVRELISFIIQVKQETLIISVEEMKEQTFR